VLRARPRKRLIVVLVFTAAGAAATWFAQKWCVQTQRFEFTLVPTLVVAVVHMAAGAFFVFFMASDTEPQYQNLGAGQQKDTALMGGDENPSEGAEEEEEDAEEIE
jgi:flagellar basal body-associated protein FliL